MNSPLRPSSNNTPLVVITGTGTEIGKTVVSTGLTATWSQRGVSVAGIKPVESGCARGNVFGDDGDALATASSFDVTQFPPPYIFEDAVSPHLAARREGRTIDLKVIFDWVTTIRSRADGVVLELPGGLFSPLSEHITNADLLATLYPTLTVLVAPDRLGVLHDVRAARMAAETLGIRLDAIVLSTPPHPDTSTGTNEAELTLLQPSLPVITCLPRARRETLAPYFEHAFDRLGALQRAPAATRSL